MFFDIENDNLTENLFLAYTYEKAIALLSKVALVLGIIVTLEARWIRCVDSIGGSPI